MNTTVLTIILKLHSESSELRVSCGEDGVGATSDRSREHLSLGGGKIGDVNSIYRTWFGAKSTRGEAKSSIAVRV
jgi:hypothetical protein